MSITESVILTVFLITTKENGETKRVAIAILGQGPLPSSDFGRDGDEEPRVGPERSCHRHFGDQSRRDCQNSQRVVQKSVRK